MPHLLQIITEPDSMLRMVSEDVDEITDKTRLFMDDMLFTMHQNDGIGLAAVQVGVLKRIIVIDIPEIKDSVIEMPMFMVNAKIVKKSTDLQSFREGCLSVPGFYADVERSANIVVSFLDYYGVDKSLELSEGVLSVCIQHEIDHMNGIVFIDHLSKLKKDIAIKKMIKQKKHTEKKKD